MIPRPQRDQVKTGNQSAKPEATDAERPAPSSPAPSSHERDIDARPTGLPTSERHAMETAHQWESETKKAGETSCKE